MNGGTIRASAAALALLLVASVPMAAHAAPVPTAPVTAPAKGGPLSPRLEVLAGEADTTTRRQAPSADEIDGLNEAPDGRLYVDVRVTDPSALAEADALPGTDIEATAPDRVSATLAIPPAQLAALALVAGLVTADEVPKPVVDRANRVLGGTPSTAAASTCPSGATVSQGSAQMKVPSARTTFGVDGTGVKVGIISTSYGVDKAAAASQVRAGELPGSGNPCGHTTPVQVVADATTGSDEGRAMAQIVHDLAPGAQLLFADAGASQIEMANHVRALRDAGAQVIVDDIGWFDATIYQDGFLAAAVDEVVADGVTYLSAAGNMNVSIGGKSVGSYETSAFRPTTCPSFLGTTSSCHDFNPGSGVSNQDLVTIPAHSFLMADLSWNEPMFDVGTDLDFFFLDDSTGEILDAGGADNPSSGRPVEWAFYENDTNTPKKIRVVVANYGKTGTPRFKMVFTSPAISAVQWSTSTGGDVFGPTLFGHAASPAAIAVGANTTAASPTIETYSSRGPATLCWEPARGTTPAAAIPGCTAKTIDVLGTDGVSTAVRGFQPFYGTSAAAPHVAAVAALLKQQSPCARPEDIRAALKTGATALGAIDAGGSGRTNALASLGHLETCATEIAAPPAPKLLTVSPVAITVTVDPPSTADAPASGYEVELIRPGGEVVTTASASDVGAGPWSVDFPVEVGSAYRVRARTDHGVAMSPWSTPSALIVPPFASASAYMSQLATDFTGQPLTDDGRQVLTFVLEDGWGPGNASIQASQFDRWAPQIDPVIRLFSAYFLRKPDPSGLNYWLAKRRSGTKLDTISSTFAGSNEFKTRYGSLSNNAFVQLVYRNVLSRSGDASGISYWTKQLDLKKKSRGQVMTGFSESNENLRRRFGDYVTIDLFFGMLRRIPTNDELAQWSPVVAADYDQDAMPGREALAKHLLTSQEYLDRVS